MAQAPRGAYGLDGPPVGELSGRSNVNANDPKVAPSLKTRLLRLTPLVLVLLALGVGILPRLKAHAALRTQTQSPEYLLSEAQKGNI